jgi:phosphatidylethanolamine-binding protein (PEBP) family uncharacterized protein
MRALLLLAIGFMPVAALAEDNMNLSFSWGEIPLCTTGRPNIVPNPRFELSGVPAGTERVEFRMTDLDVPSYDHGGGSVAVSADGVIAPGAFTYKSPCPPRGAHTYEWIAEAMAGGAVRATARAQRDYPE